ncbi:uncharacterized protein VP01_3290g2, partial [Puccinia sorghi]
SFIFIVPCLSWKALFSPGNLDKIVEAICKAGPQDQDYTLLLDSIKSSASRNLKKKMSRYTVNKNLPFHGH